MPTDSPLPIIVITAFSAIAFIGLCGFAYLWHRAQKRAHELEMQGALGDQARQALAAAQTERAEAQAKAMAAENRAAASTSAMGELQKAKDEAAAKYTEAVTKAETSLAVLRAEKDRISSALATAQEQAAQMDAIQSRIQAALEAKATAEKAQSAAETSKATAEAETIAARAQATDKNTLWTQANEHAKRLQSELTDAQIKITQLTTTLEQERTQTQKDLALIKDARDELGNQFKVLADKILEEKSARFTAQNQTNLDQILTPLKAQLTDFKKKVEDVYTSEGKDRSALAEQVKALTQLNNNLSQDAQNLALALKGDRKMQGNWGEFILDDVLEKAGLKADQHYTRQSAVKDDAGQTVIPDVVINLPSDRRLVVDSKMSLSAYCAFSDAKNDDERSVALKQHLTSINAHIKGLSDKNYQKLYGLKSLDFVIMFVPLEPAFMLAVTNDRDLFQQAWDKNILLVSPSTLLFVVRTVAYLWRQEDLSLNAKEISNRGAELYDRLVGFVTDLEKVGERIQQAQESYGEAHKKLSTGKGHVIRQAEMLKELGVKPTKKMPLKLLEVAAE